MEFNKIKIGQSLQKKRKKCQLTQKELAKQLCVCECTVKKWEQGIRTPQLTDLISLANTFKTNVSILIGETETEGSKNTVERFKIINSNAKKSDFFEGYEDVIAAWNTYYSNYDKIVYDENICTEEEWCNNNNFLILINPTTRNVYAIRDYGRYCLDPDNILFQTNYIPIFTHQPENKDNLKEHVNYIVEMYQNEISGMFHTSYKPLFLLRYCGTNNYIAWSLTEEKLICVYDYKTYHSNFYISKFNNYKISNIKLNEEYSIIPPSENLIKEIGLELNPYIWEHKMQWDIWEERAEKKAINNIPKCYKEIYDSAITMINKGRSFNYGLDNSFAKLENRVERLEHLLKLGAPNKIIEKEISMISDTVFDICISLNPNIILEKLGLGKIKNQNNKQ